MRFVAFLLALAFSCQSASAAVVSFLGTVNSATGPLMAVGQQFKLEVTYNPNNALSTAFVTSIQFTSLTAPNLAAISGPSGGIIQVTGAASGNDDLLTIALSPNAFPGSSLLINFSNDVASVGPGAFATAANISALVDGLPGDFFTFDFGGANGLYSGSIAGVPEPSSMLILGGLVVGGAYRIRRRRLARKTEDAAAA